MKPASGKRFARIAADLLLAVVLLPAVRFAWVWFSLARIHSDGPRPVIRFLLVAGLVTLGPGLALRRLWRGRPSSLSLQVLFVIATSLAASGFVFWQLYFLGLFSRCAAVAALFVFFASGLWGLHDFRTLRPLAALGCLRDRWRLLGFRQQLGLLLSACLLEGVFEAGAGVPFKEWDALVSWDKWAADMGVRNALGGYLVGGYPQFYPGLASVFYKIARTGADVLPVEHMLLHGFVALFPALLSLALWVAGRRHRFSGTIAFFLFLSNASVFRNLAAGYVDIPLVAMSATAFVLTDALCDSAATTGGRLRASWPAVLATALLFFAVVFLKGTGILLCAALLARLCLLRRGPTRWIAILGFEFAVLATIPFFAHQFWLARHPALTETSPFLHALPFHAAHTSLFAADGAHLRSILRSLADLQNLPPRPLVLLLASPFAVAAFLIRKSRPAAAAAAAWSAFWFFTASYDFRNAYPAFCLAAVAAAMLVSGTTPAIRSRAAIPTIVFLAYSNLFLLAFALPGLARTLPAATRPLLRAYAAPSFPSLPRGRRHMAFRPEGDLRNILFDAPYGLRARHLNAGTSLYRLLAPRGAYSINANSYRDARPHDIAIRTRNGPHPPREFTAASSLRRTGAYESLWIRDVRFSTVAFSLEDAASGSALPSGAPLPANGTYLLRPQDGEQRPGDVRDGILELRFRPAGADLRLSLSPADAKRDPYAPYFAAWHDNGVVRLLYWMKRDGPSLPVFEISTGTNDVSISACSIGR